jgi:23S rRNA pseudouridine1911/1915/1917 synthase
MLEMESKDWVEVRLEARPDHDGLRLDVFLAARLQRLSRAEAQKLIEQGRVRLPGRPAKASCRLASGEAVLVLYPRRVDPPARCETLKILFEDEWLLAVDKPAGVLSHPSDKMKRNSVTSILKAQFPGLRPHTVHRLDRETSGALLLAKTAPAARALSDAFAERRVKKEYLALVSGRVAFEYKLVDAPLRRAPGPIRVRQMCGPGGDLAITEIERLAAADDRSLVRASPKTGRLHQIRAHLAWLGHPVLGDKIYQGDGGAYLRATAGELAAEDLAAVGALRQMLHARSIALTHPMTGARLSIEVEPPADFAGLAPSP